MSDFKEYKVTITMSVMARADQEAPSPKAISEQIQHTIKQYSDNVLVGRTIVEITGEAK